MKAIIISDLHIGSKYFLIHAFEVFLETIPGDYKISNTLYTNALIKHIKNPNIKIEDLFKMVRRTVYQQSGGKQIPWETSSGVHFSF